jgi:hypothetical protein
MLRRITFAVGVVAALWGLLIVLRTALKQPSA